MKTSNPSVFSAQNLRKAALLCLQITIICGVVFALIFWEMTLEGFALSLLVSGMYSFGLGFGHIFINSYLSLKWDWIKETNKRVWSGIITTVIYTVVAVIAINYVVFVLINKADPEDFFSGSYFWAHLFYIVLSLGISTFIQARGFMMNWKAAMTQETTKQEIVAKTETAKFETLKNQIDPHFLFNSLNVLTSLIGENPNQAEKFTTKLSKVYRYVLEQRNKELVPVAEELQFAKIYMELLAMRFEDAVQFDIPEYIEDKELKMVPLSLQLLLENAVKHNVVSTSKPLHIRIYQEGNYLIVQNNINPKETLGKSTKVGLQNIADRYGLLTEHGVKIENNNQSFKVSLPLLYQSNHIMYQEDFENSKYIKAVERVEKLKEFYQSLATYCIIIPLLVYINLRFSPFFYWFWFPAIGWGIGLIFQYLEVSNNNIFLGKNWEEQKIKELMDDEDRQKRF